jgi:uncharacterized protein (TIGR02996 family)
MQKNGGKNKPFPKDGWVMGRWYKDPVRNRPTVEAWANDPAREKDSLIIAITKQPDEVAGDTRGEALLAAVIENPDDLLARLVYADWLAEKGDVRGELIRVQCDLATKPTEALKAREGELLASVTAGMKAPIDRYVENARIRRGLIGHVTMFTKQLVKHGPEIVKNHPITCVRVLCSGAEEFAKLGTLPFLAKIPALEIESRRTPRIIHSGAKMIPTALANSPLFATMKRLEFSDTSDDSKGWAKFLTQLEAPMLEELALTRLDFELDAYAVLADKHVLPALRSLEVSYPSFAQDTSRDNAKVAAAVAKLAKRDLHAYSFSCWHFGDSWLAKSVREMLACKTLKSITIDNCAAGANTIDALVDGCEHLEKVVWTGAVTPTMTDKDLARFPKHVRVLAKRPKQPT